MTEIIIGINVQITHDVIMIISVYARVRIIKLIATTETFFTKEISDKEKKS